jgi:hypothetical protein
VPVTNTPSRVTPAPYVAPITPAPAPAPHLSRATRRPWPLIIAVLVIDVGLAAAGAWLLGQGLRHPSAPPFTTPSASKAP